MASHPSFTTNGTRINAATGSASDFPRIALATNPASPIHERYPQREDCAASAFRDGAESCVARFRFCLASQGIPKPATINRPMPTKLGRGLSYPRNASDEVTRTNAATKNSKAPATRAAVFSTRMDSRSVLDRNRHRTTVAESSSMALSPPKARSAGLRAVQAEERATMASTVIQIIVRSCRRWAFRARTAIEVGAIAAIDLALYSLGWSLTPNVPSSAHWQKRSK
jgi:hypothetical protein